MSHMGSDGQAVTRTQGYSSQLLCPKPGLWTLLELPRPLLVHIFHPVS